MNSQLVRLSVRRQFFKIVHLLALGILLQGSSISASAQSVNIIFHYRAADASPYIGTKLQALGDFNHDGFDDIAVSSYPPLETFVFRGGNPADSLPAQILRGWPTITIPLDLNGDGVVDLLTTMQQTPGLLLYKGDGAGFSSEPIDSLYDSSSVTFGNLFFDVGLVDTGAIGDILVSDHDFPPGGRVQLYLNPFINHTPPIWSWQNTDVQRQIWAGGFIDFNADGFLDVFLAINAAAGYAGFVYIFLGPTPGQQPDIVLKKPSGFSFPDYEFPRDAVNVGDYDCDGISDLGVLFNYKPLIYLSKSLFDTLPTIVLDGAGAALAGTGDVNDDGCGDIVTGYGRSSGLAVDVYFGGLLIDSRWDFSIYGENLPPIELDRIGLTVNGALDFNGDGHRDILFSTDRLVRGQPMDVFVVAGGRGIILGVEGGRQDGVAQGFSLSQNYPNPFNPSTTIEFELVKPARAIVRVYNALGEVVRTLVDRQLAVGTHRVVWDGRNDHGREVASGVYLYRLTAGGVTQEKKMVLVR